MACGGSTNSRPLVETLAGGSAAGHKEIGNSSLSHSTVSSHCTIHNRCHGDQVLWSLGQSRHHQIERQLPFP